MMDWVPVVGYGLSQTIPGLTTTYFILYPVPDYIGDQEFLYEDDVSTGLFLHRMVGSIVVDLDTSQPVQWRLMPLGVNFDAIEVLEPFAAPYSAYSPEWANLRFWDERVYIPDPAVAPNVVDHPWWTTVDITPKQAFGQKRNLWPVLAVRNPDTEAGRIVVRLRMLLS